MIGTKKIATNTIYLYIRLSFVLIISLFTVRIVLNALGDVDYGIYNVVCGFVSMFGFFGTAMTNGVQRFYNYEIGRNGENAIGRVYSSALYIQIGCAVLFIVVIEAFGLWYLNNKMVIPSDKLVTANYLFQFSLMGLLLSFLQIPYSAAIVAHEKMNYFALVGIIDAVAKLAIAYAVLIAPNKLLYYGLLLLSVNILNFILNFVYAKKHFASLKFTKKCDNQMIKEMLTFTGWNTFGSFAYVARWQGVNLLMNAFFGVIINAANGIASQVSSALAYFSGNLVLAFKPQLTQSYASGEYVRTRYLLYLMTKMSYALVYTLSIPIMFEIDYILHLWLGADVPGYTSSFSILVIISVLLGCFHTPLAQVIHATGKIRKFQIVTSIVITSILPISWICFHYGMNPTWAYWVTILVYVLNQVIGMVLVRIQFEYTYTSYFKDVFIKCLIFTVLVPIAGILIIRVMPSSFLRLVIVSLTTAIIAIIATYFIILDNYERKQIKGKIQKFI
jgi:O-antigen/teichoic acid export membrane protein